MKDQIFGVLQRVGSSFMLPIVILPVTGLFLEIGSSFTNSAILEPYGLTGILGEGTIPYVILTVMSKCGDIILGNLPLIFAMGVSIGMAKKEVAALSGSIASVLGIESLQIGVFGGIIVGLGVAYLHNKFYRIELPQVLSFFGSTRFVPIVCSVAYLTLLIV